MSVRFNTIEGTLNFDPSAGPEAQSIVVLIDPAGIDTNHAERDKHLRSSDFLDVDNYPEAGFVSTNYDGKGFSMFELFEVPPLLPRSEALRDLAITAHYTIAYGLIAVIVLHAGAAIKHQIIDKHGPLKRML